MQRKWAFISGATSGIGEASARLFVKKGWSVVLNGRREDRLKNLERELGQDNTKIAAFDVTDRLAARHFFNSWTEPLELLINNAGLARGTEPLHRGDFQDWDEMIDINVKGLLNLTRLALPRMIEQKSGHIVNLGSVAGRWSYPGGGVYCATKFAVRALSEALRMDLLGHSIRVTNIEPGMVETEFSRVRFRDDEKARMVYRGLQPLVAEDIAETIYWCVDRPRHVNIQELVIYPTDQASVNHVHRKSE